MKILLSVLCAVLLVSLLVISSFTQPATTEMPKKIGKDGAEMVLIPAGEFQMGTDPSEIPGLVQWLKELYSQPEVTAVWFENETPRHTVYLDAFYMDKHEVTNEQYRKFVQATGHREPESCGHISESKEYNWYQQPVVCVSWEDAKAYAEWAGKRLPTEAEWEKAARGGLVGKRFTWGDDWPPPSKAGNFADEAYKREFQGAGLFISDYDDGYTYTAPVGSFDPNSYGLYDMAGNVWEWCADWYDNDYYGKSPKKNPKRADWGFDYRVCRGASWRINASHGPDPRVAVRAGDVYFNISDELGFRCVAQ